MHSRIANVGEFCRDSASCYLDLCSSRHRTLGDLERDDDFAYCETGCSVIAGSDIGFGITTTARRSQHDKHGHLPPTPHTHLRRPCRIENADSLLSEARTKQCSERISGIVCG